MPPVFSAVSASSAVKALIGAPPGMRFFPFGDANQNTAKPYATYQIISGVPENYLGQLPDADGFRIQIDVWAETQASANHVAQAIRDAVEPYAYMVNSGGTSRDPETKTYRYMLDFEFQESR